MKHSEQSLTNLNSTAAKAISTAVTSTSTVSATSSIPPSSSVEPSSTEASSSDPVEASSENSPANSESVDDDVIHNQVPAPEVVYGESDTRRVARETVAQDLKDWQAKYAQAADEGAMEIDDRLDDISKRMIERQANTMGKSLVDELRNTIDAQLEILKGDIQSIVGKVKTEHETPKSAEELIAAAVRKVGLEIKGKSQNVRDWSENYENELQVTVLKAAENHFTILSNIRDLALQKIGMKWAWMEGVTYTDWKKYHLLKERFNEWEAELKDLITTHPGLQSAEDAGRDRESEAMELAQKAVQELGMLKEVSGFKLAALDDSDEFDPNATRLAAEEAAKAKAASEKELEAGDEAEDVSSHTATVSLSSIARQASASVAPGQAAEDAQDTPDLASTVLLEETAVFADTAQATEPAEADQPDDDDTSSDEKRESSEGPPVVKPALFGAMAQSVPSRQPVMDDDDSSFEALSSVLAAMQSDVPATISSAAASAYSAAMSGAEERYSQALSLVSAQISGTTKPVHEQYLASVTAAYGDAVAKASFGLDAALSAATGVFVATPTSSGVLGLPTGWADVESIAAAKLSENQAWAASQYESAKVAIGLATATPTDVSGSASSVASVAGASLAAVTAAAGENAQKLLQNAQYNYYAGLGVAQERYSQFLAAAGSALSSVTATPTPTDLSGTLSSAQSVAMESAGSAAAAGYDAAAAGYDNVAAAAEAAGSFVTDNWNAVLDQVSAQVYGQPTPTAWYENLYSAAGDYAASATEAVGGGADSVTSAAGSYASAASEEASKQYVVVSSIISELLVGKEPTLSESIYSRLAGAYAVAASSAESFVNDATETIVSVATEATEAVKDAIPDFKAHDEL